MNRQTLDKGFRLAVQSYSLFMLKEWNEVLIDKYKGKQKEFRDFIKKNKEAK